MLGACTCSSDARSWEGWLHEEPCARVHSIQLSPCHYYFQLRASAIGSWVGYLENRLDAEGKLFVMHICDVYIYMYTYTYILYTARI